MPYPIQLGAVTDRLRNFFRLRGKTTFMLDEVVVPVTMVQDLTKGPYVAGVTPAAAEINVTVDIINQAGVAILLNTKVGSLIPTAAIKQPLAGKSFSVKSIEWQNTGAAVPRAFLLYINRTQLEGIVAVPTISRGFNKILFGGAGGIITKQVSAEMFVWEDTTGLVTSTNQRIWSGELAASPGIGSLRIFEPDPPATIGPEDALILLMDAATAAPSRLIVRGWFNEQVS